MEKMNFNSEIIEKIEKELKEMIDFYQEYNQIKTEYEEDISEKQFNPSSISFNGLSLRESEMIYRENKLIGECELDRIQYLKLVNEKLHNQLTSLYTDLKVVFDEITEKKEQTEEEQKKLSFDLDSTIKKLIDMKEIKTNTEIKYLEDSISKRRYELDLYKDKMNSFGKELTQTFHKNPPYPLNSLHKQMLEHWIGTKLNDTILFDSYQHDKSIGNSVFDSKLLGHSHLVIVIETTVNEKKVLFGVVLFDEINKVFINRGDAICDQNAFVFTMRERFCKTFKIKQNGQTSSFFLYPKESPYLFQIGLDIKLYKNNERNLLYQNDKSIFNYENIENALIGKTGDNCFVTERITVFTFN